MAKVKIRYAHGGRKLFSGTFFALTTAHLKSVLQGISLKSRFALLVLLAGLTLVTLAQDDVNSKIADAMSAGPASIAENATILDCPDAETGEMTVLREGTNDWVCIASSPAAVAAGLQDSACLDEVW